MKKIFNLMMIALVAMCSLQSCSEDCDHNVVVDDHSADLVGTWTCLQEGFAEALVIDADGSMVATGVAGDKFWEGVNGNITVKDGKATLDFEDDVTIEGHFDIIPGIAFSINQENGERVTFNYCKEDLSEEILGMWVCTQTDLPESNMTIQTYQEDGKVVVTGFSPSSDSFVTNRESTYKVVGDLMIQKSIGGMGFVYFPTRLTYTPNGTTYGDILSTTAIPLIEDEYIEATYSWLRIKQGLSLTGKAYAYSTAYVSNAKGKDEEFSILGHPFNMANIKTANFDMLFHSDLFCAVLKENSFKQLFRPNGQDIEIEIPITVEGNKVTLDMSAIVPALRKVEMYMFQDADDSQLHIYMPTQSFINYFANLEIVTMLQGGKIDPTDNAAVEKVFTDMEARIESINVSFVMKAIK